MKIIPAIAIVFFFLGVNYSEKPTQNKDLQRYVDDYYKGLNEDYFDNKLPKDTAIVIRNIDDPPNTIALTTPLGNHKYVISLDPRLNATSGAFALSEAHEVCHEATNEAGHPDPFHGEYFQNCMKRLANEGAFEKIW